MFQSVEALKAFGKREAPYRSFILKLNQCRVVASLAAVWWYGVCSGCGGGSGWGLKL